MEPFIEHRESRHPRWAAEVQHASALSSDKEQLPGSSPKAGSYLQDGTHGIGSGSTKHLAELVEGFKVGLGNQVNKIKALHRPQRREYMDQTSILYRNQNSLNT